MQPRDLFGDLLPADHEVLFVEEQQMELIEIRATDRGFEYRSRIWPSLTWSDWHPIDQIESIFQPANRDGGSSVVTQTDGHTGNPRG